ncbi:MAG: hypothetical protein ACOH2F_14100 [Cellulomonas sp.]
MAKHGISRDEALSAITHAHYVEQEFDEPRVPGHVRPTLFIGPSRLGRPLLEVMVEITPRRDLVVFHGMVARAKYLARMEGTDYGD